MNVAVNTKTRGLVQITRVSEKLWTCSIAIYGEQREPRTVTAETKDVIKLLKILGAPAPSIKQESHIVEFYNCIDWSELEKAGFNLAA